jgi:hypothetical protein
MLLVAFSKLAETVIFYRTFRSLDLTFGTAFWFIFSETGAGQLFAILSLVRCPLSVAD